MKRLLSLTLILLLFAGCAAAPAVPKASCTVKITGLDGAAMLETAVSLNEGDTALSVTERAVNENKLTLDVTGSGATAYVSGIGQLYELDEGPMSGWLFKQNGEIGAEGCAAAKVADGDTVEWFYITDFSTVKW